MKAKAVFLDRDGTIIENTGYINHPDQVQLMPGAAPALQRLAEAGHLLVVVSNQSGVARGMLDEDMLSSIHDRLEELLAKAGVSLDGVYYCPYLSGSDAVVEAYRRDSPLRKPRPGMLLQAAQEMNIDLTRSWMIGDSRCDVEAGTRAGCRTIWLCRDDIHAQESKHKATMTAENLTEAVRIVEQNVNDQTDQQEQNATSKSDSEIVRALDELRETLKRDQREARQTDFSVLRLFGALLQMFALVVALWGFGSVIDDEHAAATARLALAGFLQLASISAFAIDRFR